MNFDASNFQPIGREEKNLFGAFYLFIFKFCICTNYMLNNSSDQTEAH